MSKNKRHGCKQLAIYFFTFIYQTFCCMSYTKTARVSTTQNGWTWPFWYSTCRRQEIWKHCDVTATKTDL